MGEAVYVDFWPDLLLLVRIPGIRKKRDLTLRIIRPKPLPLIGNDGISPPLQNLVQLIAPADVFRIMTGGRIPGRLRWAWIKLSVVATPNLLLHLKDQVYEVFRSIMFKFNRTFIGADGLLPIATISINVPDLSPCVRCIGLQRDTSLEVSNGIIQVINHEAGTSAAEVPR